MDIVTPNPNPVRTNSTPHGGWQAFIRSAVRNPRELCQLLHLSTEFEQAAVRASRDFPLFVPRGYIARMRVGDPRDPLLLQVLPVDDELQVQAGFGVDPVGDSLAQHQPGLLQKYAGRTLMIAASVCAVHCRYCFRRHFPYQEAPHGPEQWQPAIAEIAADSSLSEVILSGGDPLMLTDGRLADMAASLAEIPHLRRLRIHTRLPIVIPERVTEALLAWLTGSRLKPIVVVHANHPREIDADVGSALRVLSAADVQVLNQSVLLRGINDDADVLAELSERLIDSNVVPYYLHQLDRVSGAGHFETEMSVGVRLIDQLRARLPGYAVPRFVQEIAGERNKRVLA